MPALTANDVHRRIQRARVLLHAAQHALKLNLEDWRLMSFLLYGAYNSLRVAAPSNRVCTQAEVERSKQFITFFELIDEICALNLALASVDKVAVELMISHEGIVFLDTDIRIELENIVWNVSRIVVRQPLRLNSPPVSSRNMGALEELESLVP